MTNTEKEFDEAVIDLIDHIINRADNLGDDSKRAFTKEYMRKKMLDIYQAGKHVGSTCLVDDLFNKSHW